jgi:hypothetical protein
VRSIRWNLELIGVDLTAAPGVGNESGSRIVFQGSGVIQQPSTSGPPTLVPKREDGMTRGTILLLLIGPIFMILIAAPEQEHIQEVPLNAANEEPCHNAPDLSSAAERESGVPDLEDREDRETVAERPPDATNEHVSEDDHVGEDPLVTLQSEGFVGERWHPW